jgi:ubiquinone/menaquinone biosynthesis C-methylase UbiE
MARASEKTHWNRFWERDRHISRIYDNDDRIRAETAKRFPLDGKRTLEVGAATARDSMSLAGEGAEAFALDYSHSALKLAAQLMKKSGADVVLVCGDATAMPFREGAFDFVFHQGVLEHFKDPGSVTDECARVLKPEGTLLTDVPQTIHPYTVMKKILIALGAWFAGWETQYTPRELRAHLRQRGLEPWAVYGRYFSPSLSYRLFRELLIRTGVYLPLRPVLCPPLNRLRSRVRSALEQSMIGPWTSAVIGVFARKPGER